MFSGFVKMQVAFHISVSLIWAMVWLTDSILFLAKVGGWEPDLI